MPGVVLLKTPTLPAPAWLDRTSAERLLAHEGALQAPIDGTVYGVALNVGAQVEQMAEAMTRAPYMAPPSAPVLYIKTPNTYRGHGAAVAVPAGVEALEVGATLAVVFGRAFGLPMGPGSETAALQAVAGYTLAIDVCLPHESLYRPAIGQRCRDGFLPIGPWIVSREAVADPNALEIVVHIDGEEASRFSTADLVRPIGRLIAEIAAFQTFMAGDVLLVGLPPNGPRARAGQSVSAEIAGIGRLDCRMVAEATLDAAA